MASAVLVQINGLEVVIVGLNEGNDVGPILRDAALDMLVGGLREPAFDLVEPGGAGRCEVEVVARVAGELSFDRRRFVVA